MPASRATTQEDPTLCPQCGSALVTVRDELPWCSRCSWNLDAYTRRPEDGWYARRVHPEMAQSGFDGNQALYRDLLVTGVTHPGFTLGEVPFLAVCLVLWMGWLAIGGLGLLLMLTARTETLFWAAASLTVPFVALAPRWSSLRQVRREHHALDRATAPTLFDLVDRVCRASGQAPPDMIALSSKFEVASVMVGLKPRRVMDVGQPLLSALEPQERVALLSLLAGSFVSGFFRYRLTNAITERLLWIGNACNSLRTPVQDGRNVWKWLSWPWSTTLAGVSHLFGFLYWAINLLWRRDSWRTFYCQDQIAAAVAGSDALSSVLDVFVLSHVDGHRLNDALRDRHPAELGATAWRELVDQARAQCTAELPLLRQLSLRTQATDYTHPPLGLRLAMLAATPHRPPQVVLTEAESAQIDTELLHYEELCRQAIAAQKEHAGQASPELDPWGSVTGRNS